MPPNPHTHTQKKKKNIPKLNPDPNTFGYIATSLNTENNILTSNEVPCACAVNTLASKRFLSRHLKAQVYTT